MFLQYHSRELTSSACGTVQPWNVIKFFCRLDLAQAAPLVAAATGLR